MYKKSSKVCALGDEGFLLKGVEDGSVSRLWLVVAVEQKWVVLRSPGIWVPDAPDGDADALGLVQAGVDDVDVVSGTRVDDIDLGEGDLGDSGAGKRVDGGGRRRTLSGLQMTLRSDSVDGDAGSDPLLNVVDHAGRDLGIVCGVEAMSSVSYSSSSLGFCCLRGKG